MREIMFKTGKVNILIFQKQGELVYNVHRENNHGSGSSYMDIPINSSLCLVMLALPIELTLEYD